MCTDEPDDPEASPYETEMLNQAENRLKEYEDTFVPIENMWMDQQAMYGTESYETKKQNEAVTASKMTNSGTTVAGAGMDPSSGSYLMGSQSVAGGSGAAAGSAAAAGTQVARDQAAGGALDVVSLGREQTATSASLNSQVASASAGVEAAQYQAAQTEQAAMYGAAGTVTGMAGMAGYKKWGGTGTTDPV